MQLAGAPRGTCSVSDGDVASALAPILDGLARPAGHRLGVVVFGEADSDILAVFAGWLERHDLLPARRLARVGPRLDEHQLRSEDAVDFLRRYGHEYVIAWVPAVDPVTGVSLDVAAIAAAGRLEGCVVGCDATAVAAQDVRLAEWEVDSAIWKTSGNAGADAGSGIVTYVRDGVIPLDP